MASTSLWDRFTGRPRQSAAFGIDEAIRPSDDAVPQAHTEQQKGPPIAPPRARGVDTAEGARRSKSADSEITLVEDEEEEIQLFEGNGKEGSTRAPSFTIDGPSRGLLFDRESDSWRVTNRELYHRLQNVSRYPKSTLAIARRHLLAELQHLLTTEIADYDNPSSIMSLPSSFEEKLLDRFLQQQHDSTTKRYADYSARRTKARQQATQVTYTEARRAGCEMFDEGTQQCKRWLQQASVVKYVDGSWLASLYRNSTGGLLQSDSEVPTSEQRRAARASWLVMSEELGDGDLARSHVAIYERLMDRLNDSSAPAPKGEEEAFLPRTPVSEGEANDRCWRAACVQLCLSASPCDFLPEALGFNLAYESLPYHLLVSAREIEELLDADAAYYFYLHISIDNSSSGHSAMAKMAVVDYLAAAHEAGGANLAAEMWARIKLGFSLAEAIPTTPLLHGDDQDDTPHDLLSTVVTMEDADDHGDALDSKQLAVIDILKRKAKSASGLHASVQAQLAGRSISDWLDINHVEERVPLLLDALSESPLWIKRGDADESRFVRAFEWGGKMFGAFTGREVSILRDWVNSLQPDMEEEEEDGSEEESQCLLTDEQAEAPSRKVMLDYIDAHCPAPTTSWVNASILRPQLAEQAISSWSDLGCVLYPALVARPDAQHLPLEDQHRLLHFLGQGGEVSLPSELSRSEIRASLPTLLLTTSLLERVISTSCGRLATPLGMACVKILRILLGFTEVALPSGDVEGRRSRAAREVGCMGTDDLGGEQKGGVWEQVQELHSRIHEGSRDGSASMSMSTLLDRPASQLALPALMLQLGADVWTNMPVLLGMTSFLTGQLLDHKSVLARFEDEHWSKRLASIACRSNAWAEHAITLGESDTRGFLGSNWKEGVDLGKRLAQNGIAHALSHANH